MSMRLTGITIYPIKSCGGISLNSVNITPTGLEHDRIFMLVDAAGNFLSQRQYPEMATITTRIWGSNLLVMSPKMSDPLSLSLTSEGLASQLRPIVIHDQPWFALDKGFYPGNWFSQALGVECRLVKADTRGLSGVRRYAPLTEIELAFQDEYPILGISEASLTDLNRRLMERGQQPVPMNRFRPNLIFGGVETPYDEDVWQKIQIGDEVVITGALPCARCSIPTIDQTTGETPTPAEPTATLAKYRQWVNTRGKNKVWFGMNFLHLSTSGTIRMGDNIIQVSQ